MRFVLLPGNRYDTIGVAPLIDGIAFDAFLGDKAFDANWIDPYYISGPGFRIGSWVPTFLPVR